METFFNDFLYDWIKNWINNFNEISTRNLFNFIQCYFKDSILLQKNIDKLKKDWESIIDLVLLSPHPISGLTILLEEVILFFFKKSKSCFSIKDFWLFNKWPFFNQKNRFFLSSNYKTINRIFW